MRASTLALFVLVPCAWHASGCVAPAGLGDEDPKQPGEALGRFAITGQLTHDTCGAESLRAPQTWSFEVKLSRDGSALYWLNGREAIVGEIDKAGSFQFETHLDLPLAERRGAAKGCTIVRRDSADGALTSEQTALNGNLSYSYESAGDSDCSEFTSGSEGLPEALPCRMTYALRGSRLRDD